MPPNRPPQPPARGGANGSPPARAPLAEAGAKRGGAAAGPALAQTSATATGRHFAIEDPVSIELDEVLDGKYRLMQRLDQGGMGSLFVAHNIALDVPVAVKIIRADLKGPEKHMLGERLLQEARAAAKLGHPAIVRMMDFGIAPNGDPYLVMELLDGEDLATTLDQRGRLSPTKAVRIMLPIMHALATAHEQGIVHRDLKPENIFLSQTPDGQLQPKLIDFGIAKLPRRTARRLTMLGDALGTPDYMAPEQARGEDVDARADIWGLSVILYETLTGQLPFEAATPQALLVALIEKEPRPIKNLGVDDPALAEIVHKGLVKNKLERWQSMREFGRALATWLARQGVTDDISGTSLQSAWLQRGRTARHDVLSSLPPPADGVEAVRVSAALDAPTPVGQRAAELEPEPVPPAKAGPPPAAAVPPAKTADQAAKPAAGAPAPEAPAPKPAPAKVPATKPEPKAPATKPELIKVPTPPSRWPLVVLWLLALTGIAAAVTGYLGIDLPYLPAHLGPFWRRWLP